MKSIKSVVYLCIVGLTLALYHCSIAQELDGSSAGERNSCDNQAQTLLCDQTLNCAEQCAVDRHASRAQCQIYYDVGTCFGLLSCIEDTELGLRQCQHRANIVFSICASRCYRQPVE